MNYIDLFSGIGGFALGAYLAGMKFDKHYFSEIEPYCVELYQKRFPDAIALGDITKHEEWNLEQGEYIITGGFPCQDISVAGRGAGITGKRSGLWFAMHGVISRVRPRFAIMENVGALTFRGLDTVLGSLAEIGYDAEWQAIRADDVGAPHRRERIWIVAYPNEGSECYLPVDAEMAGTSAVDVSYHWSKRIEGGWSEKVSWWFGIPRCEDGRGVEAARDRRHIRSPFLCRMDDGIPRILDRLRGLGNAIVPQIAEMLFRQIRSAL